MSSPSKLTLSHLTEAVAGGAVAIRAVSRLEPAGGPADKVFPPTYVKDRQSTTKYAFETRTISAHDCCSVAPALDSRAGRYMPDSAGRTKQLILVAVDLFAVDTEAGVLSSVGDGAHMLDATDCQICKSIDTQPRGRDYGRHGC